MILTKIRKKFFEFALIYLPENSQELL